MNLWYYIVIVCVYWHTSCIN